MTEEVIAKIVKELKAAKDTPLSADEMRRLGTVMLEAGAEDSAEMEVFTAWPRGALRLEYLKILNWAEKNWPAKRISILDVATGNGLFSHLAAEKGFYASATHEATGFFEDEVEADIDLKSPAAVKSLMRDFIRYKLGVSAFIFRIETPASDCKFGGGLDGCRFDLIYAGQATFHWPPDWALRGAWTADEWRVFLNLMAEKFLNPGGRILITAAGTGEAQEMLPPDLGPIVSDGEFLFGKSGELKRWQTILTPEYRPGTRLR
jgi:SAM-dependent methyltransferase